MTAPISASKNQMHQFFANSINKSYPDAYFRRDYKNIESFTKSLNQKVNRENKQLLEFFLNSCDVLDDEYLTGCSNIMLTTNKRLFMIHNDNFISVPLNKIVFYGLKDNDPIVQFYYESQILTYLLKSKEYMYPKQVNTFIEKNKYSEGLNSNEIQNRVFKLNANGQIFDEKQFGEYILTKRNNLTYKFDFKALIGVLIVSAILFVCVAYFMTKKTETESQVTNQYVNPEKTSNIVDVDNATSIKTYLTSKTFRYSQDNMTIKFYPEGYYELKKNYEVALTGKWTIGERKYSDSVMLYLENSGSELTMMLSTDGKIMDKASLRVFQ